MSKQTELVGLARTTSLDEVNAAYSAGALSNRNLIINGAMQVSQRGSFTTATSINSGAYYLDRFKTVLAGSTATITHKTNQVLPSGEYVNTLLQTLAGGGYTGIQQFVEDFNRLKGQTVTLSAWVKSNVTSSMSIYDGVSQPSTGHTGGGQWEKLTLTYTCPTNITQMRTEVWTSTGRVSGDYFEVAQFQLEVGDTATPFEHRSYGQELALCQRYYETGDAMISGVKSQTPTGCLEYESFKVSKRSPPTMTKLSMGSLLSVTDVLFFGVNYSPLEAFGHTTSTGASGQHIRYSIKWAADAEL